MWDGIGGECVVAHHCVVTGILVGRVFVVVVVVGGRRGGKDDGSVRFSRVVDRDLVRRDGGPVGMDIDGMWHCLARKVRVVFHHVTPFDGVIGVGRCGVTSPPFLGSGPGDPELLTLAAYRRLQDPSALVVADRLVSPEILELVRGEVRIARKLPGCAEAAQTEIYEWCAEALRSGRDVVRLKIGDPFVFGRGGEEVLYFRSAVGVEPVVIPGVSAALAAPLLGGIPVTHRGVSSQVVTCTGYGRNGTSPDLIRYHPEQTVVFLMAVGRLRELCANLQRQAGYPADTPVAIVERAGCPQQRTLVGDMTDIADLAETHTLKPPCTIVVGGVVKVLLGTTTTTDDGEACSPLPHGLIPRTNERDAAVVPS